MTEALTGKRAVVTGASRGLGRAFARSLAGEGAKVVINATSAAGLEETATLISERGGTCEIVVGSVADEEVATQLIERCVSRFGGIDALVNNAGINRDRTLMKMSAEEFDDVVAVNLRGTWACSKHAALAMKESGGCIVNITSNSGLTGSVGQTNYAAAKAGVVGMTFTWAQELSRYGIRCNAVWPLALTQMTDPVFTRRRKQAEEEGDPVPQPQELGFGDPDDVAQLIAFLVSDAASEINGQVISFNGRKLALWTHPHEINVERRDGWTLSELISDFGSTAGRSLEQMYRASPT
jgi:NAD(P)-dependent dehydrogenase (short-subunit alcohol dehydrogenase family)